MGKLLKIEWLKIRRYKAFLWLVAIFCISVFGINYIVFDKASGFSLMGPGGTGSFFSAPFNFPMVWQTISYFTGFLHVIPGLLIILLTANEFTFRTHRQSIINGLSRRQFMAGKIGLIITIAIIMTILAAIMSVLFGLAGQNPFSLAGIQYLGYFFVQAVMFMSVAFLLVMWFKRSGVSIGIFFLYAFIVENLLALILNYKIKMGLGYYLPIKAANKLIPAPVDFPGLVDFNVPSGEYLLITGVAWIVIFLTLSVYRFDKSDL